jgi:uncharacterized protein YdeI (YjbR/CyaY-like superfamily)
MLMTDPFTLPLAFPTQKEWASWLAKNYTKKEGIWLRFYKKASGIISINHDQALDSALCYGWIDGQAKPFDEDSWIQKFTPRRAKSLWSKRNIEHTERLIKTKKMRAPGSKEIERAKADGRWHVAYDSPSKATVPEDFLVRLSKNKKALAFFNTLSKTNRYAIAWRLQTAVKPETREKRMVQILEMMKEGKKFHG